MCIMYFPTKEMVADYLNKPLKGSLFRVHCNSIMVVNKHDESCYFDAYTQKVDR